jgi:hypothetical protein
VLPLTLTVNLAVPPLATVRLAGWAVIDGAVQVGTPVCVTVNVCPAIVSVPVRVDVVEFCATE